MSPSAMKQMSWLSGLSATARPRSSASRRTSALQRVAEREHRVAELARGQHAEHVGLVLGRVDRAVQRGRRIDAGRSGRCTPRRSPSASALSSTAANLIFSLQRRHGFGVRPGGVLGDEVVDDVLRGTARRGPRRRTGCRCTSAARRASRASSSVQQPRAPVRNDCGLLDSARCTPVTSWPASTARAAATAESTPPDIAARTLTRLRASPWRPRPLAGLAGALDDRADRRRATASTSAAVEVWPRENRSEPRASASGDAHREQHVAGLRARRPSRPSRSSTRCPGASSSSSSASPSQPGNEKCALPGSRCAVDRSGSPPSTASGHGRDAPGDQVVAQRRRAARPAPRWRFDRDLGGGGEPDDGRGVEGAGADVALLAAAVQHRRRGRRRGRATSSADAERAADLVAGDGHGVEPARGEVDRQLPEGLHRVGVERHAVRPGDRGELGDRLHRADLVVGPHDGDQRDRRRVGGDRGLEGCRVRPGRRRRPAATRRRRPRARPSHRAASRTAWCSTALARMRSRRRVRAAARPVEALDREVVRLGAAAGEEHLARAGRRGRRRASRGPPRPAAGRPGRRRAATTGCRSRPRQRGHRLDRLGEHRRGRRVVEVGRVGLGTAVDGRRSSPERVYVGRSRRVDRLVQPLRLDLLGELRARPGAGRRRRRSRPARRSGPRGPC